MVYPLRISLLILGLLLFGFGESLAQIVKRPAPTQTLEKANAPILVNNPEASIPLPFDDEVIQGTLANGLRYFILPNERPLDRAELRLMVKAGSILEDDDQQGLAHFVEHMAFNGTENYAENDLIDYLQSTGAKFGPDLNAYTSFDETVYMLQVRTDSSEILDKGMGILRDWAGGITFAGEEIDKERGVVLGEWRSGLGAQERMRNKTLPIIFANSRYANRLPIGDTTVLKNAPYEALTRFYKDWYRPDLMAVAVVGNVDPKAIEQQIKELFGSLKNPAITRERVEYSGPSYDKTQVVTATDAEATFTLVRVNYLLPEKVTKTENDFREGLASGLYNQMLSGRFREQTEDPSAPYSYAGSGRSGFIADVDAYGAYAVAKPGLAIDALLGVLKENKRVLVHGFTLTELARAKANVLESISNAAKEAANVSSSRHAQGLVSSFLEDEPMTDADTDLILTQKYLSGITLAEVNALAKTYLAERARAVVVTGPETQPMPTEKEILAALAQAKTAVVTPYEDNTGEAVVIPELTPVAITTTVEFDTNHVTIYTLANGVRVALKQTDFKDNEILFSGISRGGTNQFGDELFPDVDMLNGVGSTMGLGPYTPSQLRKALAGKRVAVRASVSSNYERIRGQATPETLKDLFELVYLHFQGSSYDETLADAFMQQQNSFIENLDQNPDFKFSKAISEALYGVNNPRHQLPSQEMLAAVDTKKAFELYQSRFANATDWQFNFVGNFDRDTLLAFAKTYLGNLPNEGGSEELRDPKDGIAKGELTNRFKAGQAPKSNIMLGRGGPFVDGEMERLTFQTMIGNLSEELRDKLREDLGGVYGVRVSGDFDTDLPEPTYFISISFNAEPERVDELIAAVNEIVERFKTQGPKEKTITANRTAKYESLKSSMSNSNGFWLGLLSRVYTDDRNIDKTSPERLQELLGEVSIEDIQQATQLYFEGAATTKLEVVMSPE
ncbi:MAG: M16 family metallopeptidase [Saprospiraceae bacterium]